MQEQQAELEARLQDKQLQVVKAAEQFQPVMANLEKVWHEPVMSLLSWFCMSDMCLTKFNNVQLFSVEHVSCPSMSAGASCKQNVGCKGTVSGRIACATPSTGLEGQITAANACFCDGKLTCPYAKLVILGIPVSCSLRHQ